MKNRRSSLLKRLALFALPETLICVASLAFAAFGCMGYMDFTQSDQASLSVVPMHYSLGPWPFIIALLFSMAMGAVAIVKADQH